MSSLFGRKTDQSLPDFLRIEGNRSANSVTGITGALGTISDGLGNKTPLKLSTTEVEINGVVWPTSGVTEGRVLQLGSSNGAVWAELSTNDILEGSNLYYTPSRFNTAFASKTTADLAEGSNKYFTAARARAAIDASGALTYDVDTGVIGLSLLTTSDVEEGENLYFTPVRFSTELATKSTTDIKEGANQYFTNERARAAITVVGDGGSYNEVDGVITLNSGAVTLVDDQTFTGRITFSNSQVVLGGVDARIISDFSSEKGTAFRSSTVNGATRVGVVPNGTSDAANITAFNRDATNTASFFSVGVTDRIAHLDSGSNTNSKGALPILFRFSKELGGSLIEVARVTPTGAWSFGSTGTAVGTTGQVLTSNGSTTNPTWQTPSNHVESANSASKVTGVVGVANGGTGSTTAEEATAALNAPSINPRNPKDGDIQVSGMVISVYADGYWRQVFPPTK
jgi:hypothetical protein